jgi:hypothetical protein
MQIPDNVETQALKSDQSRHQLTFRSQHKIKYHMMPAPRGQSVAAKTVKGVGPIVLVQVQW